MSDISPIGLTALTHRLSDPEVVDRRSLLTPQDRGPDATGEGSLRVCAGGEVCAGVSNSYK